MGLSTEVRFWVGGVWVTPDLLGSSIEWRADGRPISLIFPADDSDLVSSQESETPAVPAVSGTARMEGSSAAAAVNLVAVAVELEAELSLHERDEARVARDGGDIESARAFALRAREILETGIDHANTAVNNWLSWVRATGKQPWLGIASTRPPQYGRARLLHPESDDPLFQLGPENRLTIRSGGAALGPAELSQIRHHLVEGHAPSVASLLLNDAMFLAREAISSDAPRALLAAAMACEVKSKEVILSRCYPDAQSAVRQLVHRTSNLPQLLDVVLLAATGLSLRAADKRLYEKVSRLFRLRNEIVHEGKEQNASEAWPLVVAAQQTVRWLDEIEPRGVRTD